MVSQVIWFFKMFSHDYMLLFMLSSANFLNIICAWIDAIKVKLTLNINDHGQIYFILSPIIRWLRNDNISFKINLPEYVFKWSLKEAKNKMFLKLFF